MKRTLHASRSFFTVKSCFFVR